MKEYTMVEGCAHSQNAYFLNTNNKSSMKYERKITSYSLFYKFIQDILTNYVVIEELNYI